MNNRKSGHFGIFAAVLAASMAGCQSAVVIRDLQEFRDASDEFMHSPVKRTFAVVARGAPSRIRGRAALLGRWSNHVITNTKCACPGMGRYVSTHTTEYDVEMEFRDDGTYVMNNAGSRMTGRWEYSDGMLSTWCNGFEGRSRVAWYGDNKICMRRDNEEAAIKMNSSQHVKECRCWYDDEDCRWVRQVDASGNIVSFVTSPEIYIRIGGNGK